MLRILTTESTFANNILYNLRHEDIQLDRSKFRSNLEKIGILFAFEISKTLNYVAANVSTVLGNKDVKINQDQIVILSILRAGIPLQNGLLTLFEDAEIGFISAYRKERPDGNYDISADYITCPDLENKIVIICDPMLATGRSFQAAMTMINDYGNPKSLILVSVIGSDQAVDFVRHHYPAVSIFLGDLDEELTAKSYIVPGLGDAGDLAFGRKLQG